MSNPFGRSFASLSSRFHYNQPEVLVKNIGTYIDQVKAKSLLDIGAGHSTTAIPLSQKVHRYLAIEENGTRAEELRASGLDVVVGTFPLPLSEEFDMVLSSHSVPEGKLNLYNSFLSSAWEVLNPQGTLLVVTFKGSRGDTVLLREEITRLKVGPDPQLAAIMQNLASRGNVRVEMINSYLQSPEVDDIVAFIARSIFWSGDEEERHLPQLQEILTLRYKINGCYIFPTQHLFISVVKEDEPRMDLKGPIVFSSS